MKKIHAGLLQSICQNVPDAICIVDTDWIVRSWNQGAVATFGYEEAELLGKNIAVIMPPDIVEAELEHCRSELNANGKMSEYQTVRLAKDGRTVPIEMTAVLLKQAGEIFGYASIMRDITERKQMEGRLTESEAGLRTIFNASNDAVFIHDINTGRILDVNEKFFEMYECTREELPALDVASLSAPDSGYGGAEALKLIKRAGQGEQQSFEWTAKSRTGRIFPVEVNLKRVAFMGRFRILAAVRDITERKRAEENLLLTQFSMDHAAICVYLVGRDARFLYINEQTCRTLGYSREELLSMAVYDLDPDYPVSIWDDHWAELKKAGSLHFETKHRRKDGTFVPMEISLNYLSYGGREYNVAFGTDISGRKKVEHRLRENEEKYRSIVETSADWIWEMDLNGILTFNNPAVERILGYTPGELAGKNHFELIYEEDRGKARAIFENAIRERAGWKQILLRAKHKDGTLRYIECNSITIFSESGAVTGLRGSDRDVTEIRLAQENLQKMYKELEVKVEARTRELGEANEELLLEIEERRRAMELIRRSKELSDALNDLGGIIHSSLDIDKIMERVVAEAAKAIGVDATMIGLFEGDVFRIQYVHNMPAALTGRTLTRNEFRAIGHAAAAGDALAFNDAFNDERLNIPFVREAGIRSLLVAPLFIKNEVSGALVFYGFSNRFIFGEEHIDFARKLSASVSLALEKAGLYQALQESEKLSGTRFKQLQTIYDTAPVGLCFIDRNHRFVSMNRKLAEINGVSVEDSIGRTIREVIPDWAERVEGLCNQAVETGRPVENVEMAGKTGSAPEAVVVADYYPLRDDRGEILGVNIVVQDITRRKQIEQALGTSERRLKTIINSIPDMVWLKDAESRFIVVNEPIARAAGKKPGDLIGKTDLDIWPQELAELYRADDREVMKSRQPKRVEEPLAGEDGEMRWIETIKSPYYSEEGEIIGTVGIARDTTERRRMEEQIRHMAQHDALTGLPNRRLFIDILNVELAQARRHKSRLAILFLDLDRFKEINDTLGHEAGDNLLKQVSARLTGTIREADTVARIGGDEFNIILADIDRPEHVTDISRKIVKAIRKPILLDGHELEVTTSIGISVYPDDSEQIDTLLRYADIAMYHAKESGRNMYRFYNPSINVRSIERMTFESLLRQAIARSELSVHYQPQIDIKTRKIFHAEALVRWNHPERGLLLPVEFLPLAEETGFITSIDEWVLRTVCAQAKSWKDAGLDTFCVTVNLSARQFGRPDLVSMISTVLRETGMDPDCLDIEVTENTAMSNVEQSASQLRELQALGVHISIDDFGTGYSSLNYLKKLPIERLKIDKSFIRDIVTDADDRAIINAVTSMARKMGIRTVAEGVENEEQFAFLRDSDCDEVQGFLFSKPVPAREFGELVAHGV